MIDDSFPEPTLEDYRNLVTDSGIWIESARGLFTTAVYLSKEIEKRWVRLEAGILGRMIYLRDDSFEAYDYQAVYFMLISFSLENIFKAFLVEKHSSELGSEI
jgi:hypothetical protein